MSLANWKWMDEEGELDEEANGWMRSQIGQRRTFIKLISFIHFGRWNVHSINPLNPMILTWQSQINLDQGPTTNNETQLSQYKWSTQ